MIKNVLITIIVIAVVVVGIWLFMKKGSDNLAVNSPSASPEASATLAVSPSPTTSPKIVKSQTLADGLKIDDEVIGTGATAKAGQTATVNYTGWLSNGTKFDSNVDPAFGHVQPFSFQLGQGQVIQGWDEGVAGMKVGGKRILTIPPAIGYGAAGAGNGVIPPNATLTFEVELLSVK